MSSSGCQRCKYRRGQNSMHAIPEAFFCAREGGSKGVLRNSPDAETKRRESRPGDSKRPAGKASGTQGMEEKVYTIAALSWPVPGFRSVRNDRIAGERVISRSNKFSPEKVGVSLIYKIFLRTIR